MLERDNMKTDIAIIEQYDFERYKWDAIAFVGPDRAGGEIEVENADEEGQVKIRIRYLG